MSQSLNQSFDKYLIDLKNDPNISRNDLRTIIETLVTIYKNLLAKDNEKSRKINTNNSNFQTKVWRHSSAKQLLLNSGWGLTPDLFIVFENKDIDVSECLKSLVTNRDVRPDSKDWVNSEKKFVNPSEVRDSELRQMAEKERLKELEEFEKCKKERQLVAENVKKEIQSDIKFRQSKSQTTNSLSDISDNK